MYDIGGGRMNIVKGVAGLIRRTSGYGGEFGVGSPSHRFPVPSPKIQFRYFSVFSDFNTVSIYKHGKCMMNRL